MAAEDSGTKGNFDFLKNHDPIFSELALRAEEAFASDPNTTLIKLRQLGEAFAQDIATRCAIPFDSQTTQATLLYRLQQDMGLDPQIREIFHTLRIEGNKATHAFRTCHRQAMDGLKLARSLAVWFHRSFGKNAKDFKPGPFVPPKDPSQPLRKLQEEMEQLKASLKDAFEKEGESRALAELMAREKEEYAALAELMDAEARSFEERAKMQEQRLEKEREAFESRIKNLQEALEKQKNERTDTSGLKDIRKRTAKAAENLSLNEELTRILIDARLRESGWEADSQSLTYSLGARPEKGRNLAIAEWPLKGGHRADYLLFAGLIPLAVVEAKRENINVASAIPQAERYARAFRPSDSMQPLWENGPWPDGQQDFFGIPFAYACNGRPFLPQMAEQSGTWFRDLRSPSSIRRALENFHSPEGLLDILARSRRESMEFLKKEPFGYLRLREYQKRAITAVEEALSRGERRCLVAMATGTGKTRTIIGLMYRLLKAEGFHRILFLVDRTALGNQAMDAFKEAPLEQNLSLSRVYNIAEMGDMAEEAETRIQVATVQAMVRRIFMVETPPAVDTFDCIIVDEAHRGYVLDQEMDEGELQNRDAFQYQSAYRRVLEYFDAVRIGLTATPARHTTEIFGRPVFTYSYREAVAEDWLIDHEPPVRYETMLTRHGIHFDKGEVQAIDMKTGAVELAELEDELDFDVESFNRRVITEGFNRVICGELAKELDPFGDEKTMIFCATQNHAEMVKRLLDEAFFEKYNGDYNEASVRIITGRTDKVDQVIRLYRNERYPVVAITVDLLTTGIDVPPICHLVFLRRVRSRILFEQMMGRATRRCDAIGKIIFRIYDPVGIYAALEKVTDMKPLVKNPGITIAQLLDEITDAACLKEALGQPGEREGSPATHAHDVLDQLSQKLMRVMRKAEKKAETKPEMREKLAELEKSWGCATEEMPRFLRELGPEKASDFIRSQPGFLRQVEEVQAILGSYARPLIYEGADELLERSQTWGEHGRPEDYLDAFTRFIREEVNRNAALMAVVNRPKELTRDALREIRLFLDAAGFPEAHLRKAWASRTNEDIAASVIGFIRQAALGEPLVAFETRVHQALQRILAMHGWSPVQKQWLKRLAAQLTHEVVVDAGFINRAFAAHGGVKRFDKVLDNRLDAVLETFSEELWQTG